MEIVSAEEITLIPRIYAIGKRPLSLLLGWGELTYTRLIDGNTPSPEHALELRHIKDDPAIYARALAKGRDRITEAAYTRSFKAVDGLLAEQGGAVRATRIFAVADALCILAEGDLTPSALQRLVYYVQGTALGKQDMLMFDDLPRACASGPIYDRISAVYSYDEIQEAAKCKPDELLTSKELKLINQTFKTYGVNSGQELSRKSREEAPWQKARKRADIDETTDSEEQLTAKSMRKWFGKGKN